MRPNPRVHKLFRISGQRMLEIADETITLTRIRCLQVSDLSGFCKLIRQCPNFINHEGHEVTQRAASFVFLRALRS